MSCRRSSKAVKLDGAVFLYGEFSSPWCAVEPDSCTTHLSLHSKHVIIFHLVTEGKGYFTLESDDRPLSVTAGDIVILPHGHAHRMGNGPPVAPMDSMQTLRRVLAEGLKLSRFGGQRGYRESEKESGGRPEGSSGTRAPGMLPSRTVFRCTDCGTLLPSLTDGIGQCPKCRAELHACQQCTHFAPGQRFECAQPVPERLADKRARNDCTFFSLRGHSGARNVVGIRVS